MSGWRRLVFVGVGSRLVKLYLKQNRENREKTKLLGELGERLAVAQLVRNGFRNVENLNQVRLNHEFADLLAERGGERFVISVKTRRKWQRLGGLNAKYNLGKNWRDHSNHVAEKFQAIPAWIAIQIDGPKFSMYFGTIRLIEESNGIPMEPEALEYYECLVSDGLHGYDEDSITPDYKVVVGGNLDS